MASLTVKVSDALRAFVPAGQTVSAGVARWNGHENGAALLDRADRALYRARAGRDQAATAWSLAVTSGLRLWRAVG